MVIFVHLPLINLAVALLFSHPFSRVRLLPAVLGYSVFPVSYCVQSYTSER